MVSVLLCVFVLVSTVIASVSKQCLSTANVCFSLHIPNATIASGNGDIHMQITAPTSYSWIAIGQGTSFTNSNLFIIYTSSDAKNVTLSPRLSDANHIPWYGNNSRAELLAGSTVQDGLMVANIKCSNCQSWAGGKMDFSANTTDWIWAAKLGSALNSDDKTIALATHDEGNYGQFQFDASAKGGEDANPFLTGRKQRVDGRHHRLVMIHGYLACLVFAVLFPIGGMMTGFMQLKRLLWVHALCQILGFVGYAGSASLGIWLVINEYSINISGPHALLGLILLAILLVQAPIGYMHHLNLKKAGQSTKWTHLYIWVGRIIVPVGIANGVFGFRKASESVLVQVVFGTFGAFILIVYVGVVIYAERRRKQKIAQAEMAAMTAMTEVEEAWPIEKPRNPSTWSDCPTRTTSWLSGSTGAPATYDSRVTLVEPRKSCGSLNYQQQKQMHDWQLPTKPADIFVKGRSQSLPAHSVPSVDRSSSVYSLQPDQEVWDQTVSKRASALSIMTLFPIVSAEDLTFNPTDSAASHIAPFNTVQPKQQQWKSVTWSADVTDSSEKQRSQSVSCQTESSEPTKEHRSKSVGWPMDLQYTPEEWRSRSASWPREVPEPSDDDYYQYRFGYGREE